MLTNITLCQDVRLQIVSSQQVKIIHNIDDIKAAVAVAAIAGMIAIAFELHTKS